MRAPAAQLILTNGTVIDPGMGINGPFEVVVAGGRVVAVAPSVERGPDTRVIDVRGGIITPGLIDLHTHVWDGISVLGVSADATCLPTGVTTAVDAGTAGWIGFDAFRSRWIQPSVTRVLAFLNLSGLGIQVDNGWELGETEMHYVDVERSVATILANPDVLVGVKVRMATNQTKHHGIEPLRRAIEIAERTGTKVMIHITEPGVSLSEVFDLARPGDIVTHLYHGRRETIVAEGGRVLAAARRARERGVRMDVGHGGGSFTFAVAQAALADGFRPDTISTDLHTISIAGACKDMPTTMSKFMAMGMSVEEVVAASTVEAARSLGRPDVTGTLAVGDVADIAVFEDARGAFQFEDVAGARISGERMLVPRLTVRAGRLVANTLGS